MVLIDSPFKKNQFWGLDVGAITNSIAKSWQAKSQIIIDAWFIHVNFLGLPHGKLKRQAFPFALDFFGRTSQVRSEESKQHLGVGSRHRWLSGALQLQYLLLGVLAELGGSCSWWCSTESA